MNKKICKIIFNCLNKDNEEIFDYNSNEVSKVTYNINNEGGYFIKDAHNKISITKNHGEIRKDDKVLFRVRYSKKNKSYEIINPIRKMEYNFKNVEELNNKIWLLMKSTKNCLYEINNNEYYLNENDIIKFGRKKYLIIKKKILINDRHKEKKNNINIKNKEFGSVLNIITLNQKIYQIYQPILSTYKKEYSKYSNGDISEDTEFLSSISMENKDENNINVFQNNNLENDEITNINNFCIKCENCCLTEDDLKLKLCKCPYYVHYNCFKKFLEEKLIKIKNNESTVISYILEKFNCGECGKPYPLRFQIKYDDDKNASIKYSFYDDIKLPDDTNYMILESLSCTDEKYNNKKYIYVLKLTDDDLTIGSNDKNDIIDADKSISEFHTVIKFNKETGNITLVNESNFGTSVLVKNNIKLIDDKKIYFQVENAFIIAEQKNSSDN